MYAAAMPKPRYTPPSEEVAARIAEVAALDRQINADIERRRELLTFLVDRENGLAVPIAHIAEVLGVERKTIYRRLGRRMT